MLVSHKASTCDVCMEEYSTGGNLPHSISCGHIFCQKCLDHLLRHICPLCRSQFSPQEVRRLHVDLQSESPTVTTADDSSGPRLGVDPYAFLILSLTFVGSIFIIWGILTHVKPNSTRVAGPGGWLGMLKLYTDDLRGLRVGPYVFLILSLTFVESIFIIWGILTHVKPNSTRVAGPGGWLGTMLGLYTDDSRGLRVRPYVFFILSLTFIGRISFIWGIRTQVKQNCTRAAAPGGWSGTMLKLYTDDSRGLRVDPYVVPILALAFIGSIFFLHIFVKTIRSFTK